MYKKTITSKKRSAVMKLQEVPKKEVSETERALSALRGRIRAGALFQKYPTVRWGLA